MIYSSWDIEQNKQKLVILGHFLSFIPPSKPQISKFWEIFCHFGPFFEKMKKIHGDIITLHMHNINDNHMMYVFWDIECNRLLPLDYFLPFYPLNNPKNQTFEKMEKLPGDIILNKCTINDNHMMYGSSDMKHDRQNFFVILDHFLPFYPPPPPPPLRTQKSKFWKTEKNAWRYHFT